MPHHHHRTLWARVWILVTFLLVMGGQYFFYRFSMDKLNSYPISQGMTFGCTLWTTVLLVAMWMRFAWSRYVLITLICLGIFGFGAVALMLKGDSLTPMPQAMRSVVIGLLFYAAALVPLGASNSVRYYLGPRSAGMR